MTTEEKIDKMSQEARDKLYEISKQIGEHAKAIQQLLTQNPLFVKMGDVGVVMEVIIDGMETTRLVHGTNKGVNIAMCRLMDIVMCGEEEDHNE